MSHQSDLLQTYKTLVVVGLSGDPSRTSHRVARYMQDHGYRVIPVNPMESKVLGERCYAGLVDVPGPVDFVDVFRRPEFCAEIAREAVSVGAKVLWLQQGVMSAEARAIALDAGIHYVEDACVMAVHSRELE